MDDVQTEIRRRTEMIFHELDTNPEQLAALLGVSGPQMRQFLRDRFPRPLVQKNTVWVITLPMVIAATRHLSP
jgi:hypothetical protein